MQPNKLYDGLAAMSNEDDEKPQRFKRCKYRRIRTPDELPIQVNVKWRHFGPKISSDHK